MRARTVPSRGQQLADRLHAACSREGASLVQGARELPTLTRVAPNSVADGPLENTLTRARKILIDSGRVYMYGDSIVLEQGRGVDAKLIPLTAGARLEPIAPSLMA